MMVVDTEVVVEEDITENADRRLTTKIDHAMIGHVPVLILHVSFNQILIGIFDLSTLSGNPVFYFYFFELFCSLTFVIPLFFLGFSRVFRI